jgi:hypothetical protein
MGTVVTYVCDVSGKSSNVAHDFVEVHIDSYNKKTHDRVKITKLVHVDVAKKLGLTPPAKSEVAPPEVSLEGKLKALMVEYVDSIVEDAVQVHMENYQSR